MANIESTSNLAKKDHQAELLTCLVNTCDSYQDVWEIFSQSVQFYWPDRKASIVFNTEQVRTLGFKAENTFLLNSSEVEWGARLMSAVKKIETPYILMTCEDFILDDFLDNDYLYELSELLAHDESVSVIYLSDLGLESERQYTFHKDFSEIKRNADYRLNTAPAIWRKSHLLDYVDLHDSPWAWEVFGSFRASRFNRKFLQSSKKIFCCDGSLGGAIYRGKWVDSVVKDLNKKFGLAVDFTIRGYTSDIRNLKRPWRWKFMFLIVGFKMIGPAVFLFVFKYARQKLVSKFFC